VVVVYKSGLELVKALWIIVRDKPHLLGLAIHNNAKVIG